jgi:hypothetical protein
MRNLGSAQRLSCRAVTFITIRQGRADASVIQAVFDASNGLLTVQYSTGKEVRAVQNPDNQATK